MEMSPIIRPVRRPFVFNRVVNNLEPATAPIDTTKNREEDNISSKTSDSQETYFSQADLFSSYQDDPSQDKNDIANYDSQLHSSIDGAYQQKRTPFLLSNSVINSFILLHFMFCFLKCIRYLRFSFYELKNTYVLFSRNQAPMTLLSRLRKKFNPW